MQDTIIGIYIPAGAAPIRIVKLPRQGFNAAVYKLLNISCYDVVRMSWDRSTVMLVDDEGLLRDSPYNVRASLVSRYPAGLVGDALVVGEGLVDGEPDFVSVSNVAAHMITLFASDFEEVISDED